MLSLNPGDNQGLRYLLAACLLRLQDDAGLERLLEQQEDDDSAYMVYTRALMAFRKTGASKQAKKLAERVSREAGPLPHRRIERAFLIALSRPPRPPEVTICTDFLERQAERFQATKISRSEAEQQALKAQRVI